MNNIINWFVIPVKIFTRAHNFYNVLLDKNLPILVDNKGNDIAVFGDQDTSQIYGCISDDKNYQPSDTGTIIYLNTFGKMDEILNRVIPIGGKIKMPKTTIGEHGYIAHIEDSEGNIIGLHEE